MKHCSIRHETPFDRLFRAHEGDTESTNPYHLSDVLENLVTVREPSMDALLSTYSRKTGITRDRAGRLREKRPGTDQDGRPIPAHTVPGVWISTEQARAKLRDAYHADVEEVDGVLAETDSLVRRMTDVYGSLNPTAA